MNCQSAAGNDKERAAALVDSLLTAPPTGVPYAMQSLVPLSEYALPPLRSAFGDETRPPAQWLHAAMALAEFGQVEAAVP